MRTIELTDEVEQFSDDPKQAPAFLVLTFKCGQAWVFPDWVSASDFADDICQENDIESWPIYPLYAGKGIV